MLAAWRSRSRFAEIGYRDFWQSALISAVTVSVGGA